MIYLWQCCYGLEKVLIVGLALVAEFKGRASLFVALEGGECLALTKVALAPCALDFDGGIGVTQRLDVGLTGQHRGAAVGEHDSEFICDYRA